MLDWRDPALLPCAYGENACSVSDAVGEDDNPFEDSGILRVQARKQESDAVLEPPTEPEQDPELPITGNLHILVQSASGLPDKNNMFYIKEKPNPIAHVTFRGKTLNTKTISSTNTPRWNEELVWEKITVGGPLEETFDIAVQLFNETGMGFRNTPIGAGTREVKASALRDGSQEFVLDLIPKGNHDYKTAGKVNFQVWIAERPSSSEPPKAPASHKTEAGEEQAAAQQQQQQQQHEQQGPGDEMDVQLPAEIPTGDWSVTVHVYEAKNIRAADANGCCARIGLRCGGQSAATRTAPRGRSALWHETFHFRAPVTSPLDFQALSVTLDMQDVGTLTSPILASASIPLPFIYAQNGHTLRRRWAAMAGVGRREEGEREADRGIVAQVLGSSRV